MAVTNGREYEAVQHEIATVEGELKVREDQTISLLFELDELHRRPRSRAARWPHRKDAAGVALAGEADDTQRHRLELAAVEGSIAAFDRRSTRALWRSTTAPRSVTRCTPSPSSRASSASAAT